MSFPRFLIYTLIFAEIIRPRKLYLNLKSFPLVKTLLIAFFAIVSVGIFDNRHGIFLSLYRVIDEFLQTFFIIFLCYKNFKKVSDWEKLTKSFLIISIILCFYGFYNYLTKSNPYDSFITKQYNIASNFDQYVQSLSDRFRINSFTSHPIYYGYLTGILFIQSFYGFYFIDKIKYLAVLALPLLFINLIMTNSRTPIISFIVGFIIFVTYGLSKTKIFKFILSATVICFALYATPIVREKVNNTLEIFKTGGGKIAGSSLEMRTTQLNASFDVFLSKPIFGHGLYYINENLGWDKNPENRTSDEEFEGFESYVYHLLIEQGICGIISNIIFFSSIWIYFIKKKKLLKEKSALGLSILSMFLTFIIGTGTVNSWTISMGLLGVLVKNVQNANEDKRRIISFVKVA